MAASTTWPSWRPSATGAPRFPWDEPRDRAEVWRTLGSVWSRRAKLRGASTITQQLAKNLYLSPDRNPLRKVKEGVTAYRLEAALEQAPVDGALPERGGVRARTSGGRRRPASSTFSDPASRLSPGPGGLAGRHAALPALVQSRLPHRPDALAPRPDPPPDARRGDRGAARKRARGDAPPRRRRSRRWWCRTAFRRGSGKQSLIQVNAQGATTDWLPLSWFLPICPAAPL